MPRLGLGSSLTGGLPPLEDITSFISTWTVSGDETARTVALPLVQNNKAGSANTINFKIDCGDETAVEEITAYNHADRTHIYAENGTYTVTMSGTIQGFKFDNGDHKTKIRTITQWGTFNITNKHTFWGCSNLNVTATDTPTISSIDLSLTFRDCAALASIGDANWDTGSVTLMTAMFQSASIFNQDISGWDVTSLQQMDGMFYGAADFNQPIGAWTTTSSLSNLYQSFRGATDFDQDLSNWVVSGVTGAGNMFLSANSLSSTNWSNFLIRIEATTIKSGVNLHGGDATPTVAGAAARDALEGDHSWVIVDGDG